MGQCDTEGVAGEGCAESILYETSISKKGISTLEMPAIRLEVFTLFRNELSSSPTYVFRKIYYVH